MSASRRLEFNLALAPFWFRRQMRPARAPGRGGEPPWMPAPEIVARARADLVKRGVVQFLACEGGKGLTFSPLPAAPALAARWLWWAGAVSWVALWPALLALTVAGQGPAAAAYLPAGGMWPAWTPVGLLALLSAGHMVALAWPVWRSARQASQSRLRRRFGQISSLAEMLALEPGEFEAWCAMLFQLLGYQVDGTPDGADHGIDLAVSSEQLGRGLVQCKRYRGTVGEPAVRDLFGAMAHENAAAGWLVTTGGISRQAREWAAGKPIELWDGQALAEIARQVRR